MSEKISLDSSVFFYIKKRFVQYFSCDRFYVFKKTVYLINNWILLKVSE